MLFPHNKTKLRKQGDTNCQRAMRGYEDHSALLVGVRKQVQLSGEPPDVTLIMYIPSDPALPQPEVMVRETILIPGPIYSSYQRQSTTEWPLFPNTCHILKDIAIPLKNMTAKSFP